LAGPGGAGDPRDRPDLDPGTRSCARAWHSCAPGWTTACG